MPIINNPFNGKLNLDVADYRIDNNDYTNALNITRDAQGEGQDRVVSNILGNTNIPYTLPSGTNKIIGFYGDKIRNRAYYFLWNSNGFDSILYLDVSLNKIIKVLQSKTDSDGINILNFNPSYKVLSVNIFYRDNEGDILFFNDGLNPPKNINVASNYGTSWKLEYILVAKAPPIMPPKVVYENDDTLTTNNLRNKLFQFSYRYVFVDNEKSVWSSNSIVPLPFQASLDLTEPNLQNNSVISISVSTGAKNVRNIELAFRETNNGTTSNYYLIRSINKAENSLSDNSIFTYKFYNDSLYSQIDVNDTLQLQDWVPQKANASELANGNVLLYSGITEGYDKTNVDLVSSSNATTPATSNYFYDPNGLLFFATCNGLDSGSSGTEMSVFLYGTLQDPAPATTTTTTYSGPSTTTTTIAPPPIGTKYFLAGTRATCGTGTETPIRGYIYFDDNTYLPNLDSWYKDSLCPTYSYKLISITPVTGVSGTPILKTPYATSIFACDCVTTTTTAAPGTTTTSTSTTTTLGPKVLNNPIGTYVINAVDLNNYSIGISYNNLTNLVTISSILNGVKTLLLAKGWKFISLSGNELKVKYDNGFRLYSSGFKNNTSTPTISTSFANAWSSSYQYAIQYFDAQGRTIGAQTDISASFNTPYYNTLFCQTFLSIKNRPPLEAVYYQLLRSNNITFSKRLFWITEAAWSSPWTEQTSKIIIQLPNSDENRYGYLDVSNIQAYNERISSSANVVSYTFTDGDRIKFFSRFDVTGNEISITNFDCEILGTVTTVQTNYGLKVGNFIKINYPTDYLTSTTGFGYSPDFLHYRVFIYNYNQNTSDNLKTFYEFGKCFGIGNQGTNLAYHIGLEQTQAYNNPSNVPAIISATNGDLFYRKRNVIYTNSNIFTGGAEKTATGLSNAALFIKLDSGAIITSTYLIQTQNFTTEVPRSYSDDLEFFLNKTTSSNITVSIKCSFLVTANAVPTNGFSDFNVQIWQNTPYNIDNRGNHITITNLASTSISTVQTQVDIDQQIVILPQAKVYIVINGTALTLYGVTISVFEFNFAVLYNSNIEIIEDSFSDNSNLITNSNGRPSVIEENARKVYFPTLIRFGGAYQTGTNINEINRFKYENFDEYDRGFGDVLRLHVRDRYLKVYQKFKVGNVPILTQIVKDSANNPLQANTDTLINKIQYYEGNYGIGDAATSLAWNNFADYFVDNIRGVVLRLSQNGIEPLSILYHTNAFFVAKLNAYRQDLNNGAVPEGQIYTGNPCIYGAFDSYTNKYIIALEEINRYTDCNFNGGTAYNLSPTTTTTIAPGSTTTTIAPSTTSTTTRTPTTTTTTLSVIKYQVQRCVGGVPSGATYVMQSNDVVPIVNSYYKIFCVDILIMDGVNCWKVISISTGAIDGNGTFGTRYLSCDCDVITTTTTTTVGPVTYIGPGIIVTENSCTQYGSSPTMYLNSSDYAIYVANGGCLSNGVNTVNIIRDGSGNPINGIFYFVYNASVCDYTTYKSTDGVITLNSTQC